MGIALDLISMVPEFPWLGHLETSQWVPLLIQQSGECSLMLFWHHWSRVFLGLIVDSLVTYLISYGMNQQMQPFFCKVC